MRYWKFAAQVFFAAVAALVAALTDDQVDAAEWINVFIIALGAINVLGAGNLPAGIWSYTKTIVSAATAAATLLVSFVSDGGYITQSEWLQIGLAAAAALGVAFMPGPKVYDAAEVARRAANLRNGPA
jgi:hypothetical protein